MVKNKFNTGRTFLLILSFLILHSTFYITQATVRYVSHSGSNTPPYTTWETAADSIMSAINISVFGDTIYVANGVYKERVDMIPGLTLIGAGMDSCVIDTREFPLTSPFYSIQTEDSCNFSGFGVYTYDVNNGTGIRQKNSNVKFCSIQYAASGITINTGFDKKPLVTNNFILEVSDGIKTFFAQSIVSGNIIYPKEDGLVSQINSAPTYVNNIIVFDNLMSLAGFADFLDFISIVKNNLFLKVSGSGGAYGMNSYEDTLINNIVIGEWGSGIFTAGSDIRNNHIENTQTGLFYDVGSGLPEPDFHYNNLWQNQANFQNVSADTTNIYLDPMFVNEDSMDFHLQMYSPLINAGDPAILDLDFTRSDIGLYGGLFGETYTYQDLAPRLPQNLIAEFDSIKIEIKWNRNTEVDFNHYNLFRDTTANFTADSTTFVVSLTDTFYQHIIPPGTDAFYYKLTATDNQGNVSELSEELAVLITSINEFPTTASNYQLYQNFPNPFNPSTKIAYKLKERGYVKLYVYDIKGELVSTLVNQLQEAGYYEVEFGRGLIHQAQNTAEQLASGIYIYQIMIESENNIPVYTSMKKMLIIK
jgi:hypothetical protein